MAGIFNLFGSVSELNNGQAVKPLQRSKTTLGTYEPSGKSVSQLKPKGLSIRSNSDLNVHTSPCKSGLKQEGSYKQQDHLKPKLTHLDNNCRSVSPQKVLSKLTLHPNKHTVLSPKKLALEKNNLQLRKPEVFHGTKFKKPKTPKKVNKMSYPEPERLAYLYDMQFEFEDVSTYTIANEFKESLKKKAMEIDPYIDEGFESDPELLDYEIPNFRASPLALNETWERRSIPDLPEVLDGDDF